MPASATRPGFRPRERERAQTVRSVPHSGIWEPGEPFGPLGNLRGTPYRERVLELPDPTLSLYRQVRGGDTLHGAVALPHRHTARFPRFPGFRGFPKGGSESCPPAPFMGPSPVGREPRSVTLGRRPPPSTTPSLPRGYTLQTGNLGNLPLFRRIVAGHRLFSRFPRRFPGGSPLGNLSPLVRMFGACFFCLASASHRKWDTVTGVTRAWWFPAPVGRVPESCSILTLRGSSCVCDPCLPTVGRVTAVTF